MLLPLLLLVSGPETAVDAERAFNRAAQKDGQWTAFRAFMTGDAIVFTPQPTRAKDALPDKNPPIAVQWWPAESYVSCDGTMAVNTGPWARPGASGYFTTVWVRQADGHYKWAMDGGDALATPRALPERPKVRRAWCAGKPGPLISLPTLHATEKYGASKDLSLNYHWAVKADGSRVFTVNLWNGKAWDLAVLHNEIAAKQ